MELLIGTDTCNKHKKILSARKKLVRLQNTGSHPRSRPQFSKFLAVLGLSKILAIVEGSEQIFPRKRSLGAPEVSVRLLGL